MSRWLRPAIIFVGMYSGLAGAQKKPKALPPQPKLGDVTIDKSQDLIFKPEINYFKSPGPVRIILEDAVTHQKTTILADDAEGRTNGDIVVRGAVRIERTEGDLTGYGLTYRSESQTGSVLRAMVDGAGILLTGKRIDLLPGRILLAKDASFTTCVKGKPDYHVTAKEVRVTPNKRVKAKNVTFWLGRVRIISLPSLTRSFNHTSGSPVPLPGYSRETGVHVRFRDEPISDPSTSLDYNIMVSLKRSPEGTVTFEKDAGSPDQDVPSPRIHTGTALNPLVTGLEAIPPPALKSLGEPINPLKRTTYYAQVAANAFVFNRTRTDLQVTRMPELGVRFGNISRRPDPTEAEMRKAPLLNPADWLINADLGAGYYSEKPTNTHAFRAALKADATSPFITVVSGVFFRYGLTGWANAYTPGKTYALLAPEVELDGLVGRQSLLGIAYRHEKNFGTTPFFFDRLDLRNEVRARYGHADTKWAYDAAIIFDLDRGRAYDTVLSLRKRLDCLEFGVTYRTRTQGFSFVLNLLPSQRGK